MVKKYGQQNGISRSAKKSVFDQVGHAENGGSTVADYREVDPTLLIGLIVSSCGVGGAVMFSRTSDGGAYAITLFAGEDRKKVYVPGTDALEPTLKEWIAFYEGLKAAAE